MKASDIKALERGHIPKGFVPSPELRAELAKVLQEKTGEVYEVVSVEEKARRRAELERCCLDVCYFIDTYCKSFDPRLAAQAADPYGPFILFPRQRELVAWLEERERSRPGGVVEKSREVGVTWVLCFFMLHRWLFTEGWVGGLGSAKLELVDRAGDTKSLFEKLRITLRKLPTWFIPRGFDWKKHSLEARLINPAIGSSLMGEGGDEIGRGGRSSLFFVDEYNKLEHPDLADAALGENTNCQILVGTPNGMVGLYSKRDHWPCFTFHWKDDPRKNAQAEDGSYPWYESKKKQYRDKPWIVRQEIDIDYLGSGHPRFDRPFLAELKKRLEPPKITEFVGLSSWSADVQTWKEPEYGKRYTIFVDVAEGRSSESGDPDWSVAHVYDDETWEQVCHYRGRPDTHSLAVDLAALGEMYNVALLVVERTGPGLSTLDALVSEFGYPAVWSEARGEISTPGFRATHTSKIESENDLASFIVEMREGWERFEWHAENTIDELLHYMVKPNGRAEAETGWHDDEVSACRMAAAVLPLVASRRYEEPRLPQQPRTFGQRRVVRR